MRLRVYTQKYIEGHLTLTEYQKKNNLTLKKIVHSQSIGLRGISESDIKLMEPGKIFFQILRIIIPIINYYLHYLHYFD